eukprot:gnl/MRDRNA2_/MRDRNA2_93953_c0_seq1.p1 gnl/MRDRNA2_/MRDRNA2_93953_c0~~gnl/MRDRNA2_/MRDRNA2_93953_c0_seq1.p1  ORF type:complete len:573 (+),score=86.20 gnl/MRDRNA2_/MRDRNA2_93953_c0_seq1:117-1721(+)
MAATLLILSILSVICPYQLHGLVQTVLRGANNLANATLPESLEKVGATVRQMAQDSHHPLRFEVVLDRSKGQKNGLSTAWLKGEGGTHCITQIDEDGLVTSWNTAHPSQAVMKDDCIIEVNGVRGNADAVLNELKQNKVLRIKIQRGGMFMRPESVTSSKPAGKGAGARKFKDIIDAKPATMETVKNTPSPNAKKLEVDAPRKYKDAIHAKPTQYRGASMNSEVAPAKSNGAYNSTANNSVKAVKANITHVVDAALRAASKAETIAQEMSRTWLSYPPTYEPANPGCFNHTGRKCDGMHTCGPWAHCSKGWCVCASWGCGDSYGSCRATHNQWLAMDLRIAPGEDTHQFVAMPTDEASGPYLVSGWPESANQEALWDFLVQPDNASVLIATKWGRDHWHGRFLDLNETSAVPFPPVQRIPYDALQAAWNLVVMPQSRLAFRHARTGLYLKYEQGKLSTCASPNCPPKSADFDVWPRIENDQEPCNGCETPYYRPDSLGVKTHTPWFLNPMEGWGTRSTPKHAQAPDQPWYMKEH